jgi:hypothetical protein
MSRDTSSTARVAPNVFVSPSMRIPATAVSPV